jgi:hypothetical protein
MTRSGRSPRRLRSRGADWAGTRTVLSVPTGLGRCRKTTPARGIRYFGLGRKRRPPPGPDSPWMGPLFPQFRRRPWSSALTKRRERWPRGRRCRCRSGRLRLPDRPDRSCHLGHPRCCRRCRRSRRGTAFRRTGPRRYRQTGIRRRKARGQREREGERGARALYCGVQQPLETTTNAVDFIDNPAPPREATRLPLERPLADVAIGRLEQRNGSSPDRTGQNVYRSSPQRSNRGPSPPGVPPLDAMRARKIGR